MPVQISSTIPSIQPTSQDSDLKEAVESSDAEVDNDDTEGNEAEVEQEAEVDNDEAEQEAEQEVDTEGNDTEQAEEDEGIEVEEWTYKGRVFFKDSDNTVYANNAGEIGDPIGQYDSVKNIVRPLK